MLAPYFMEPPTMNYADKDLERARAYLENECCWSTGGSEAFAEDVARYAADVRRETVEECAPGTRERRVADRGRHPRPTGRAQGGATLQVVRSGGG